MIHLKRLGVGLLAFTLVFGILVLLLGPFIYFLEHDSPGYAILSVGVVLGMPLAYFCGMDLLNPNARIHSR